MSDHHTGAPATTADSAPKKVTLPDQFKKAYDAGKDASSKNKLVALNATRITLIAMLVIAIVWLTIVLIPYVKEGAGQKPGSNVPETSTSNLVKEYTVTPVIDEHHVVQVYSDKCIDWDDRKPGMCFRVEGSMDKETWLPVDSRESWDWVRFTPTEADCSITITLRPKVSGTCKQ